MKSNEIEIQLGPAVEAPPLSARTAKVISMVCRLTAAAILMQTLYLKFTGAPESIFIFTKVGMEPWGRYGTGAVELVASVLLLMRCRAWVGAILAAGVMAGAIFSHLTVLGIEVQHDGGLLFALAVAVFVCSLVTIVLERGRILALLESLRAKLHEN